MPHPRGCSRPTRRFRRANRYSRRSKRRVSAIRCSARSFGWRPRQALAGVNWPPRLAPCRSRSGDRLDRGVGVRRRATRGPCQGHEEPCQAAGVARWGHGRRAGGASPTGRGDRRVGRVELVGEAFVFSHSADGSVAVSPDFFTSAWARLRSQVGLDGMRLHDLRHFQATMLLRSGVPVKNVSRRIGHRDAATTSNVYAHALVDVDREAADVVGDLLRSPTGPKARKSSS